MLPGGCRWIHRAGYVVIVLFFSLWYVLTATHLLFVLMDAIMPQRMIDQTACAAMGCGCSLDEPDRICCCTGQKVGIVHGGASEQGFQPTPVSFLAAAFCAGGFPDEAGRQVSLALHVGSAALLLFVVLPFLFNLSAGSVAPLAGIPHLPDKVPI